MKNILTFFGQAKHTRPIDKEDKYYLVKVEFGLGSMDIGWIEKEWNKEQFESASGRTVISYQELSKEDYYKQKNKR